MIIREIQIKELPETKHLYLSPHWIDLYDGSIVCFGIFNKNDELIGGFVLQRASVKGISALINPIFTSNNSLFINNRSEKASGKVSFEKKAIEAMAEFVKNRNERIVDFSFPSYFKDMQEMQWKGIQVKPKYTYKIQLGESEEYLKTNLDTSTRANIKKAEKDNLLVDSGSIEELLSMTDKSFDRQSASYHRNFLENIGRATSIKNNREIFVARQEGKPRAAVMIVFDELCANYVIGGYDHIDAHRGAMAMAMWQAIIYSQSKGIQTFDFQGSMMQPVEKFIRGFGGTLHSYYRVTISPFWFKWAAKLLGKDVGV